MIGDKMAGGMSMPDFSLIEKALKSVWLTFKRLTQSSHI
jgi:hypothetical protein